MMMSGGCNVDGRRSLAVIDERNYVGTVRTNGDVVTIRLLLRTTNTGQPLAVDDSDDATADEDKVVGHKVT